MAENILQKIIDKKKSRLIDLKIKRPLNSLLEHNVDSMSNYNFKEAIEKKISDGKIWTGTQALNNGLIDNLGTQSEALNRLKEIIGNEEIEVEYLNFEQTFLDFVRTNIFNFNSFFSIFSKELSLKNFLFKEFYFLEKNIIDLRLDCINCSIKWALW